MSHKSEFKISIALPSRSMTRQEMTEVLDSYIAQLQEAKTLLISGECTSFQVNLGGSKKKSISLEGRQKIADAQRARWSRLKKAVDLQSRTQEAGTSSR